MHILQLPYFKSMFEEIFFLKFLSMPPLLQAVSPVSPGTSSPTSPRSHPRRWAPFESAKSSRPEPPAPASPLAPPPPAPPADHPPRRFRSFAPCHASAGSPSLPMWGAFRRRRSAETRRRDRKLADDIGDSSASSTLFAT